MGLQFASSYQFWAATSIIASVLLVHRAPAYTVGGSYTWTAVLLFLAQSLAYGLYSVVIYPNFVSPLRHLPSPTYPKGASFFMGHFPDIYRTPSGTPMQTWINEIPNDGLIRYTSLFNTERLLITKPKTLAEVLTTKSYNFVKPESIRPGLIRAIGVGVLLAEGDEHRRQRKHLTPAFHFRHIKNLYPIFWAKGKVLVDHLKQELDQKSPDDTVQIDDWLSRATLDIVGSAGLGREFGVMDNQDNELCAKYRKMFHPSRAGQLMAVSSLIINPRFLHMLPIKHNKDFREARQVVHSVSQDIVKENKRMIEKSEGSKIDIISVAIKSGGFTDENLIDQMMTFIAAGHETTASAMTWAIYELCRQPECQRLLRSEIHSKFSSMDDVVDASQLETCPYLLAVCNETLRRNPVVPLTLRDTVEDCLIDGVHVPKGTKINICPAAVNFSRELWGPDAAEFKPSRWLGPGRANSGGAESNYAMLTFFHGPRSCIGQGFAKGEFFCLLAALVGKFEFEMRDWAEVELRGGLLRKPKGGMPVKMKVIEGW